MKKFLLTFLLFYISFIVIAVPFEYGYTSSRYINM